METRTGDNITNEVKMTDGSNNMYVPPSGVCPHCGYCPHCGRGGYNRYHWYQFQTYPPYVANGGNYQNAAQCHHQG